KQEKHCVIVTSKAISRKSSNNTFSKRSKEKLNRSFEGFIRKRLKTKCELNGIELIEISPNNISTICSECGSIGKKQNEYFICSCCGTRTNRYINAALNIKNKYLKFE
ncbi:MAG: transposase, partial [Firmicutes bacterium]|nr:transposase [Bacillota bacterium]